MAATAGGSVFRKRRDWITRDRVRGRPDGSGSPNNPGSIKNSREHASFSPGLNAVSRRTTPMRTGFVSPTRHWLLAGACLAFPMVTARAADWPQFLGPNRDGTSAETGLTTSWKTGGPAVAWEYPLGAGWSGPIAVGGRVYVTHRIRDQEILDCLEAATGRRVWLSGTA